MPTQGVNESANTGEPSMMIRSAAFVLGLSAAQTASSVTPENGWWWNPDQSGRGYNIEVQQDQIGIALFIYDQQGFPEWYTAAGNLEGDTFTGELQRFEGGQCATCEYTPPTPAGTIAFSISFTAGNRANVTLGNRSFDISRFGFAQSGGIEDFRGTWATVVSPDFLTSGELLAFNERITLEGGIPALQGSRAARPADTAVLSRLSNGDLFIALDSSADFMQFWQLTPNGFNRATGEWWLQEKDRPVPQPGTGDAAIMIRSPAQVDWRQGQVADDSARGNLDATLWTYQAQKRVDRTTDNIEHAELLMLQSLIIDQLQGR